GFFSLPTFREMNERAGHRSPESIQFLRASTRPYHGANDDRTCSDAVDGGYALWVLLVKWKIAGRPRRRIPCSNRFASRNFIFASALAARAMRPCWTTADCRLSATSSTMRRKREAASP